MTMEKDQEGGNKNKKRKRTNAVYKKIREQMEFYFSDSNLQRDRFLKKQIDESEDGYIELSVFLTFNKIRALTAEVETVGRALSKSSDLQLSEDGNKVKRTKPLEEPVNLEERTVYVECLPHDVDHDWLKKTFSFCGKITYISLPRYKTSGDTKGFAFVEFETEAGANKACQEMNNPPVDSSGKPGMFPKTSKQLLALHKNVDEASLKELKTEEPKESEERSKPKKHKKRRRNTSESSIDGASEIKRRKTFSGEFRDEDILVPETLVPKRLRTDSDCSKDGIFESPKKKKTDSKNLKEAGIDRSESGASAEKSKVEEEDSSPKKKKKRKRSRQKSELSTSFESETDNSKKDGDRSKESRKRKLDESQQKSDIPSGNIDEKDHKKSEDFRENRKRKSRDEDATAAITVPDKVAKRNRDTDAITASKNSHKDSTKKKKNRNRKRRQSEKETPELRVISKKQWLDLRSEYLALQKANMAELKKKLHSIEEVKPEEPPKKQGMPEFVPGVIVKLSSDKPLTRKELRASLDEPTNVAYFDLLDGNSNGFIRCVDSESAAKIVASSSNACDFKLLKGEEEKAYWEKIKTDRNDKLSKPRERPKKRGFVKLIEKAQKANATQLQKQHIVFAD